MVQSGIDFLIKTPNLKQMKSYTIRTKDFYESKILQMIIFPKGWKYNFHRNKTTFIEYLDSSPKIHIFKKNGTPKSVCMSSYDALEDAKCSITQVQSWKNTI